MAPPFKPAPPQRIDPPSLESLPLHSGAQPDGIWENFLGSTIQRNVTVPHLHVIRPEASNGRAVIIAPGGGYQFLSMTNEGLAIARDLAAEGYLALVLAYRTNPTPVPPEAFLEETSKLFRDLGKAPLPQNPKAAADLGAALKLVSDRAADWGLSDPNASVIGFSAGARTVISYMETAAKDMSGRSVALIYPTAENALQDVPKSRYFMAIAANDPLYGSGTLDLMKVLSTGGAVEFHLYETGDHGFGRSRPGTSADGWFEQFVRWLELGT
ncbi:MAG: alpha/beta hydrolase [Cypionkella sp.]|nr:alpha/beta hydrolase [Cypionkella sp.]